MKAVRFLSSYAVLLILAYGMMSLSAERVAQRFSDFSEFRKPVSFPAMEVSTEAERKTWVHTLNEYLSDRVPWRVPLYLLSRTVRYRLFGFEEDQDTSRLADGWTLYKHALKSIAPDSTNQKWFVRDLEEEIANAIPNFNRNNIRLAVLIVPLRERIALKRLGQTDVNQDLPNGLRELNSEYPKKIFNLHNLFLSNGEIATANFFRHDIHWTAEGATKAFELVLRAWNMGPLKPIAKDWVETLAPDLLRVRGIYGYESVPVRAPLPADVTYQELTNHPVNRIIPDRAQFISYSRISPLANGSNILVVGDSMAWSLNPLATHRFNKVFFLRIPRHGANCAAQPYDLVKIAKMVGAGSVLIVFSELLTLYENDPCDAHMSQFLRN